MDHCVRNLASGLSLIPTISALSLLRKYDFMPLLPSNTAFKNATKKAYGNRIDRSNFANTRFSSEKWFKAIRATSYSDLAPPLLCPLNGVKKDDWILFRKIVIKQRVQRLNRLLTIEKKVLRERARRGSILSKVHGPFLPLPPHECNLVLQSIAHDFHAVSCGNNGHVTIKTISKWLRDIEPLLSFSFADLTRCAFVLVNMIRKLSFSQSLITLDDLLLALQRRVQYCRLLRRSAKDVGLPSSKFLQLMVRSNSMTVIGSNKSHSSTTSRLVLGSLNPGSVRSKSVDIIQLFRTRGLDILAVQETRLGQNEIFPNLPSDLGWVGMERPKDTSSSSNNRGGGIGFLYKKSIPIIAVPGNNGISGACESLWLRINTVAGPLLLCCCYWRPVGGIVCPGFEDVITSMKAIGHVVIMGDFNAPINLSSKKSVRHSALTELIKTCELKSPNIHSIPTHMLNLNSPRVAIDHFLCSSGIEMSRFSVLDCLDGVGHHLIRLKMHYKPTAPAPPRTRYSSRRLAETRVKEEFTTFIETSLVGEKWTIESVDDINRVANDLAAIVKTAASAVVGTPHPRKNNYPWWNLELRRLSAELDAARKTFRSNMLLARSTPANLDDMLGVIRRLQRDMRDQIHVAKKTFWDQKLSEFNSSTGSNLRAISREFWDFVYSIRKPLVQRCLVSPQALADFWGALWSHKDLPNQRGLMVEYTTAMSAIDDDNVNDCDDCTVEEIKLIIGQLPNGKAADYIGVDNEMLKALPESFIVILTCLFNVIWRLGSYPEIWRDGLIVFLEKKVRDDSELAKPQNYRPIALLSAFLRVFEKAVNNRLVKFLENGKKFHPCQAGARSKRSTIQHAVTFLITQQWAFEKGLKLVAALLDVSKAFDSMSHINVAVKLLQLGAPAKLVRAAFCLVSNRVNRPLVDLRVPIAIERGAPQGSINGPIEFLVDIDSLPREIDACILERYSQVELNQTAECPAGNVLLFVDDTTPVVFPQHLQTVLSVAELWGLKNGYAFNGAKSMVIEIGRTSRDTSNLVYKISGQSIPVVNNARFLGVMMTKGKGVKHLLVSEEMQTKWDTQLKALVPLVQSGRPLARSVALKFVCSVLTPAWAYGVEVADPSDVHQLNQNKALRIILGAFDTTRITDMHRFCGMWRIKSVAWYRRLMSMVKWLRLDSSFYIKRAIVQARSMKLDWWKSSTKAAKELDVFDELNVVIEAASEFRDEESWKLALARWKKLLKKAVDMYELKWNKGELLAPNPLLQSRYGNIGFLFAVNSFNPPNSIKLRGSEPNCYTCGEAEGDTPDHLLRGCRDEKAVLWRETHSKMMSFCLQVSNLQSSFKEKSTFISVNQCIEVGNALAELYSIRKKARREVLGEE
jgi:hypothetical protein